MPKRNDIEDLFYYIDTKNGDPTKCWPWRGAAGGKDGDRPYFSYQQKKWLAYRLVWTTVHGEIPADKVVRHKCDYPLCCNPSHLELGTQSDNERDKYRRDRAGLPVAAVRDIKRLLLDTKLSQRVIAEIVSTKFGIPVSREAVKGIKLGYRRTHNVDETASEIAERINLTKEE